MRDGSPFLCKGTTVPTLNKWGKTPKERKRLVMCEMGRETHWLVFLGHYYSNQNYQLNDCLELEK